MNNEIDLRTKSETLREKKKFPTYVILYALAAVLISVSLAVKNTTALAVIASGAAVFLDAGVAVHLFRKIKEKQEFGRWLLAMGLLALAATLMAVSQILVVLNAGA